MIDTKNNLTSEHPSHMESFPEHCSNDLVRVIKHHKFENKKHPLRSFCLSVRGVVQGVGYRYYCFRKAKELGIIGQVSNQPDGNVRVWAEGDRSAIEALIVELKLGPPASNVSDVSVAWRDITGEHSSFNIEMG